MLTTEQQEAMDQACSRLGSEVIRAENSQSSAELERHLRRARAEAMGLARYLLELADLEERTA